MYFYGTGISLARSLNVIKEVVGFKKCPNYLLGLDLTEFLVPIHLTFRPPLSLHLFSNFRCMLLRILKRLQPVFIRALISFVRAEDVLRK